MAHDQKTLTLEAGTWGPEADRLIALAHQYATPSQIRHQVEQGGARLFYVMDEGHIVGAFVLRIDSTPEGAEGVIVSAAGHVDGVDLIATCLPAIERLFVDVQTIRFHTASPALARRMAAMGYGAGEIVCRKKINELLAATT
jgi:hypothetical protein